GLNVEACLRAGDPLGGHVVQGHVDGVAEVVTPVPQSGGELWIRLPQDLLRYCVEKGSITLDGVSVTIAALDGDRIMVAVIPHTAQVTTLGELPPGGKVNVEVDILAKYVERLLAGSQPG
ncbi:MAG: riboflavin synthase, partial [Planctomycetota bacterium]